MNNEIDENIPVVLSDDSLVKIAEMAEKRIEAIKKIKQVALKVTNSHDWVDQNGKPYLQASGAEKVARTFGISWRIDEPTYMEEPDGNYSYTYKGYFSLGSATIEAIGSRGTKDPFFSKAHGEVKPLSEIDRNDVKKSAYTNLLGNGITRILGIRNLTWEELEAAGIHRNTTTTIDYKKPEMSEDAKDLRKKIGEMLLDMSLGDKEEASNLLLKFTSFVGKDGKEVKGKSSLADISEKAMPVTYGKVKEAYMEWQKEIDRKEGENESDSLFEQ